MCEKGYKLEEILKNDIHHIDIPISVSSIFDDKDEVKRDYEKECFRCLIL